ncbi:MAG: hypothetical protein RLW62_07805 [Gammaproteobacteria bacterium]
MSLPATTHLLVDGARAAELPQAPGIHDVERVDDDGRRTRFTLALPAAPAPAPPLLVVLHYAGQPTRFYGRPLLEQLFVPAFGALGAVMVAPESLGGQWTEPANEAWVIGLTDTLVAAYAVDANRVAIGGYSMGAIGSWQLAADYPERFGALLPLAGLPAGPVEATQPTRVLATPADELFAFERFEALAAECRATGRDVELVAVPAQGHYDVGAFRGALAALAPWLAARWQVP